MVARSEKSVDTVFVEKRQQDIRASKHQETPGVHDHSFRKHQSNFDSETIYTL